MKSLSVWTKGQATYGRTAWGKIVGDMSVTVVAVRFLARPCIYVSTRPPDGPSKFDRDGRSPPGVWVYHDDDVPWTTPDIGLVLFFSESPPPPQQCQTSGVVVGMAWWWRGGPARRSLMVETRSFHQQ
jgi:hypothetical protein